MMSMKNMKYALIVAVVLIAYLGWKNQAYMAEIELLSPAA